MIFLEIFLVIAHSTLKILSGNCHGDVFERRHNKQGSHWQTVRQGAITSAVKHFHASVSGAGPMQTVALPCSTDTMPRYVGPTPAEFGWHRTISGWGEGRTAWGGGGAWMPHPNAHPQTA